MASSDPSQDFVDLIVYVPGTGPDQAGKRIRVEDVTDEYIKNGMIANYRKYAGGGNFAARCLWMVSHYGGDDNYGQGDPTDNIVSDILCDVLPRGKQLGKVMLKGSSGGAKATLAVADYLCKYHHVDYVGIHDGGFYKPWARLTTPDRSPLTSGKKVIIETPDFHTQKARKRCNWYQLWGNRFTERVVGSLGGFLPRRSNNHTINPEIHGELKGFQNLDIDGWVVDIDDLKYEFDGNVDGNADKVHAKAVIFAERESDRIIKAMLNE